MSPTAVGPTQPATPELFRRLMARWATGVSIVTAREGEMDSGLTVNAFLSVSLDPPVVLVSLALDAETTPIVRRSRLFAVNVLGADQRALSERFAQRLPADEKFAGVTVYRGRTGAALLDGALATFECRVTSEVPVGDHELFVGEVLAMEEGRDAPPLLFFQSQYADAEPGDRLRLAPEKPLG